MADMRDRLQQENQFKDSIILREKALTEALDRENQLKSNHLENEIRLRQLEEIQGREERKLRLSLTLGLAGLMLLAGVIYFQYRKQRHKNTIIQRQSEDLQILMKEIHHRVKNNLQVISSMLDLQTLTIKDRQAAEAVKEGKNRVQSMALIHQNLYQEGNVRGIRMENYILHLAENLFQSYKVHPDNIKMKVDIEELNLDVDTVIPIGLILNELITNTLKYAFKNQREGEILVELKKLKDELVLRVKDNGAGFPSGLVMTEQTSFGMKLLQAFAQKLKARLHMYNDHGACVEMHISRYKLTTP
jgi:two-component sensor histidine kinase